jgi:hypothetical protein
MQRTHGTEIDARYTGVVSADIVIAAVRNRDNEPIQVFEIPGKIYRDRMTSAYAELLNSGQLRPTDLRVLRFNDKGYEEQRVVEEWAEYRLQDVATDERHQSQIDGIKPGEALIEAKELVAKAFGVTADKVQISVNL